VSGNVTFEELIERKRDGFEHTADEIEAIISGFTCGDVADYQMAAWLMAALLNGLSADETVLMTRSMVRSGREVDLSSIPGVKVDKHSTGGVADTTTLILAPLVAACGAPVAKMSGRGLGFTGGTLDKLEAIPGFRVVLTPEEFIDQVCDVGVAVIAQSPDVDPADKKIYALRDVTATVPSIPLIVGSIISKKVAGGADAILLDVKVGSGAFMKTPDDARALAAELVRVGEALGRKVVCVMSDMDQPLGMAVGNALEVREAIETLQARDLRSSPNCASLWVPRCSSWVESQSTKPTDALGALTHSSPARHWPPSLGGFRLRAAIRALRQTHPFWSCPRTAGRCVRPSRASSAGSMPREWGARLCSAAQGGPKHQTSSIWGRGFCSP